MVRTSNKENIPGPCPQKSSRNRTMSWRLVESTNNAAATAKAKLVKRNLDHRRAQKKAEARNSRAIVEHMDDSEDVRRLKARVHRAEAERDALMQKLASHENSSTTTSTTEKLDLIPRPTNASKITIASIRQHLDLEGESHKSEWLTIRNTVRDTMKAVRLDWKDNWKGQNSRKLLKLYDAVEEAIPSLRQFKHQWGVEHLAKEVFSSHKSYTRCKDNPTTYRGKFKTRNRPHARSESPNTNHCVAADNSQENQCPPTPASKHDSPISDRDKESSPLPPLSDVGEL